jgi:hypothetical protein
MVHDSVSVVLPKEAVDALQQIGAQHPFWESPLLLTVIAAIAVVAANFLIARRSKIDTTSTNKITLHLSWATDFRRSLAIFIESSYQSIEDIHKTYLIGLQTKNEALRKTMESSGFIFSDIVQQVKNDLRNSTQSASNAVVNMRLLLNPNEQASIDISKLCFTILEMINSPTTPEMTSVER